MEKIEVSDKAVDALYERLNREAGEGGYYLNPGCEFHQGSREEFAGQREEVWLLGMSLPSCRGCKG